ncbi:antibiotic biosynthesis monooxygenase [Erythrobacter sp. KY5]|uniref:putative quinol monooxygenase n=1 Tax=Erythrobacter sp. KY5 TaxID=2011159 RepID=UPI000DBF0B9B|nr:putative quinol monooxygenase [Erythrobacter sp. KY5]AWW74246.1 antibiotic biosynthesis monooxygenase [Erythrobacter sp. KY5]
MLIVLAEATLGDGALDAGHDAFRAMIEASREEDGCLGYSYAVDILDASIFVIVEKWVDDAALAYHFQTPHMAAFQKALQDLDIEITELAKHQADDGSPLM